jgi:hypothetical protein
MNARRFLRLLLAVLVTAGLTVAPLAAPVAAAGHDASAAGMMSMEDMSADMPCCPESQKQNDCKDCPWLAICMAKVLQSEPTTDGLQLRTVGSRTLRPGDEPLIAGLTRPPPDQPPRSPV